MKDEVNELVQRLRQEELAHLSPAAPAAHPEQPTVHYTDLPEDTSGDSSAREWNFYRREVGRLLAEGQQGKWVLIKGEAIIGVWDSREQAKAVALERYLMQPVLIHQVLTREPVLRGPTYSWQCSNFL